MKALKSSIVWSKPDLLTEIVTQFQKIPNPQLNGELDFRTTGPAGNRTLGGCRILDKLIMIWRPQ